MKKFKKYLGLLFTLAMLLLSPTIDVQAGWGDEAGGGAEGPGGTRDDVKEGATSLKTGYMIWVADENGGKLSNIVFVSTYGNVLEPNNADTRVRRCLINRMGQGRTHEMYDVPVHWGASPVRVG